ncbi:hypothetical protein HZB88_02020 [archaeon]|nr:hypothetical protein [archaeon]
MGYLKNLAKIGRYGIMALGIAGILFIAKPSIIKSLKGGLEEIIAKRVYAQEPCPKPDADVVNLLDPSGTIDEVQPVFSWTAAPHMDSSKDTYEFYLWDDDGSHPTYYPVHVSSTAWKMDMGRLKRGHSYAWKLRPVNKCGSGGYTETEHFRVRAEE